MPDPLLDDELRDELVSACRTTLGDELRSLTYFTNEDFEQLYLRSDLEAEADLSRFVDYESLGFDAYAAYHDSELGEYEYTIRVFENGFLVSVTVGDAGVFTTTDGITLRDFDEVVTALVEVIEEA